VIDGIRWGRAEAMFTPAFWAAQGWYHRNSGRYSDFNWGLNLHDEVIACLLGGHGISSELNRAAFERLKRAGVVCDYEAQRTEAEILRLLDAPLTVGGRRMRYRFPARKSRFIAAALRKLAAEQNYPQLPLEFRKWLLSFPGIGLKTASWITRNYLRSNEVAIIDIHVFRAGVIMGLFSDRCRLPQDYLLMEKKFLQFARAIDVSAQNLDVIIWRTMRDSRRLAITTYREAA
jgi:thermostable 8-oxoguanine DNA glycosylase